jgi:hypothetical protein
MSTRALQTAAIRAGISASEYLRRLGTGQRYCYRCRDWHDASEFGADNRCPDGKATSCLRSVRAARQAVLRRVPGEVSAPLLPARQQAAPPASSGGPWVAIVRQTPAKPHDSCPAMYWTGPDGQHGCRAWTAALPQAARFPTAEALRDALIAAYGSPGDVPAGCHLARTGP